MSNPLGLSNNNAFGRLWPANAPFGDTGIGSSSILDPDGRPLKGAPSSVIGGVYVGDLTNRDKVQVPQHPQVIAGSLSKGAVGTAFLGPSPDGTCRAVFAVVTADGAIVQEHTQKGLDGIAPKGTVKPLLGRSWDPPNQRVEPRLGVLMNPYTATQFAAWQLFVTEPFNNTIAVINLVVFGTAPDQVFGLRPPTSSSVSRISSPSLKLPVDLAPVKRDADSITWASNTTLDEDSDFFVANRAPGRHRRGDPPRHHRQHPAQQLRHQRHRHVRGRKQNLRDVHHPDEPAGRPPRSAGVRRLSLISKVGTGFRKRSCYKNKVGRDDDSKKVIPL